MTWYNFQSAGNATTPQADDAETCTIKETGESGISIVQNSTVVDVVLNVAAAQGHQYRWYANGHSVGSFFYAAQINPSTQGRINWANQRIQIPSGTRLQLKAAQTTGASAEATNILVQLSP